MEIVPNTPQKIGVNTQGENFGLFESHSGHHIQDFADNSGATSLGYH